MLYELFVWSQYKNSCFNKILWIWLENQALEVSFVLCNNCDPCCCNYSHAALLCHLFFRISFKVWLDLDLLLLVAIQQTFSFWWFHLEDVQEMPALIFWLDQTFLQDQSTRCVRTQVVSVLLYSHPPSPYPWSASLTLPLYACWINISFFFQLCNLMCAEA